MNKQTLIHLFLLWCWCIAASYIQDTGVSCKGVQYHLMTNQQIVSAWNMCGCQMMLESLLFNKMNTSVTLHVLHHTKMYTVSSKHFLTISSSSSKSSVLPFQLCSSCTQNSLEKDWSLISTSDELSDIWTSLWGWIKFYSSDYYCLQNTVIFKNKINICIFDPFINFLI